MKSEEKHTHICTRVPHTSICTNVHALTRQTCRPRCPPLWAGSVDGTVERARSGCWSPPWGSGWPADSSCPAPPPPSSGCTLTPVLVFPPLQPKKKYPLMTPLWHHSEEIKYRTYNYGSVIHVLSRSMEWDESRYIQVNTFLFLCHSWIT